MGGTVTQENIQYHLIFTQYDSMFVQKHLSTMVATKAMGIDSTEEITYNMEILLFHWMWCLSMPSNSYVKQ